MTSTPHERRHRNRHALHGSNFDRELAISWFKRNRERTRELFDMIDGDAYYSRPISLRNPIVFYEGHFAVFNVNVLLKGALGREPLNEAFETLFERGIDPESTDEVKDPAKSWPSREQIRKYAEEADRQILDVLEHEDLDRPGDPHLQRAAAVWTILEHEVMHHETLLYMIHRLSFNDKTPQEEELQFSRCHPLPERSSVLIPAGPAHLGRDRSHWAWDNEFDAHVVEVEAFECDIFPVTNAEYQEFLEAGGYEDRRWWTDESWFWKGDELIRSPLFWEKHNGEWFWRGMFELIPLPEAWPAWVTFYEAEAYARWRGREIMTEAEYHRAAFEDETGEPREHPWGNEAPRPDMGNFGFQRWDAAPVDAHPRSASHWGIQDLVGNGWEWTSTVFAPFPGFAPDPNYPLYSTDFFDGKHNVLKGASPVTAPELIRRSFRNWFRPNYPYVYAKFRTVKRGRD